MNISDAESMAAPDDILLVLGRHQVEEDTKKEMLYRTYPVKSRIARV